GRRIGPRWRATRAPIRRPGWPGSGNAPRPLLYRSHPGTEAPNSGVWGRAPELAHQLSPQGTAYRSARLRGIGYMLYLHTQVSYPTPIDGLAGCTTQPGGEPAKPAGKYREKISGKDRGALQLVNPPIGVCVTPKPLTLSPLPM